MSYRYLLIETDCGVATVTINSPKTLNALNSELLDELELAFSLFAADSSVRVVLLTGAGEKAFVAGADIREMAAMSPLEAHRFALKGQRVVAMIGTLEKPVIAAVNGFALGGGLELALACDFIYASERARFGFPEVGLGVIPGFGGTQNMSRLVGCNRAKELIYTGRIIRADKALEWGVVNEIFPPEELLAKAFETAREIAARAPLAVAKAKDAISSGYDMTREEGFSYEASLFGLLFASQDQPEGMGAFLEKRRAEFNGE